MANISGRNGGVLCPRAPSDTRIESQCEPGDVLPADVQTKDDLHGGEGRVDACKIWFGLKSKAGGRKIP